MLRKSSTIVFLSLLFFINLLITIESIAADKTKKKLEPLPLPPIPKNNPMTPEKIELGKKLFFDRRLSGDGTTSCASCHDPEKAFTDASEISLSYPTTRNFRNAPTLINVAYAKYLFWDGRAKSLEEQAEFPIMSPFEMNQNLDFVEEEIRVVPEYRESFKKIFGKDVNIKLIAQAIAAFERTLISKNAPIDRYLRGDKNALSDEAKKGLEVFTGKGKCIECHYGAYLSDNKFHALHVPENPKYANETKFIVTRRYVAKINKYPDYVNVREDLGRYFKTREKRDYKAFKTPTLREVAKTAPYMHNGIFKSLDEVIDFFNKGGGEGNKALKPLNLTDYEKKALKTFLIEALSGEEIKIKPPDIP
ncbi:cytochrome c peroxidase [Thermodesulfovibrio aggregans]|uniref:Cytochrome c peroxidase n=1 Tax=Thermodesulfovibrio aggregans TaxID=86166 RepID=A0A0U9HPU4_9BACT|nr:cytochrome c peroxidase [Thermodesulfovibrio aggregans]GAQ95019.1 cytochrome c peroxidase [Thermodesulfovibrio aggregans]